jgi:ankyrin repeat protein
MIQDTLFSLVKETEPESESYAAQLGQFKTYMRFFRRLAATDLHAVAELACAKGLHEHLDLLLAKSTDPRGAMAAIANGILEAAFYGHASVLSVLKRHGCSFATVVRSTTRETVVHLVLKAGADGVGRERYAACLDVLLAGGGRPEKEEDGVYCEMRGLVNSRDELGNTPLHLATQRWDQSVVRRLLEMGANIGIKVRTSTVYCIELECLKIC